jgi:molybdopterin-guanine dinucleotide biosynthesis protein
VGSPTRFKIAFVGSHGVGKTTLCYGLAARLKRRDVVLEIVHEVARRCPLPINAFGDDTDRAVSLASQSWILHTQVAEELVAAARYPVVLCDRSALDNYVYLLVAAGRQPGLEALVEHWMATYDMLVIVPIIDVPSPDGLRATDPEFQRVIEDRVGREIKRRGLSALRLDPAKRDRWLDEVEREVLARLQPPQLALL